MYVHPTPPTQLTHFHPTRCHCHLLHLKTSIKTTYTQNFQMLMPFCSTFYVISCYFAFTDYSVTGIYIIVFESYLYRSWIEPAFEFNSWFWLLRSCRFRSAQKNRYGWGIFFTQMIPPATANKETRFCPLQRMVDLTPYIVCSLICTNVICLLICTNVVCYCRHVKYIGSNLYKI